MEKYLFKISLKKKGIPLCYAASKSKPIYLVATGKSEARDIAKKHLHSGLEIRSVSCMARQVANIIFSGDL
jgi:hypothetical protein